MLRPSTRLSLLLALVCGLPAKPLLLAQATPLWIDVSGQPSRSEEFNLVVATPAGETYVAGVMDRAGSVNEAAHVAKLDADGVPIWRKVFEGPQGGSIQVFGLVAKGPDSLELAYTEYGLGSEYGVIYFQSISAGGAMAAARRVGDADWEGMQGRLLTPVPATGDYLLTGTRYTATDEDVHAFISRVSPAGTVSWINQKRSVFQTTFYSTPNDVAILHDSIYFVNDRLRLVALDLMTGRQGSERSYPIALNTGFGSNRLFVRGDTIW